MLQVEAFSIVCVVTFSVHSPSMA